MVSWLNISTFGLANFCSTFVLFPRKMFPRGARFPPTKGVIGCIRILVVSGLIAVAVPDVPGPNSYNVNLGPLPQSPTVAQPTQNPITDSELDSYKHGAFLEKTDRFTEAKPSDVPGEPQCLCHPPHPIFPNTLSKDRARTPNLIMEPPTTSL